MARCRLALVVSFFVFCAVPEGKAAEGMQRPAQRRAAGLAAFEPRGLAEGGLVSPELLKQAELEILWETKLPIKVGESLERLFIPFDGSTSLTAGSAQGRPGNRIYGLTSANFMVSLNRETGNVIFSRSIAESGFPVVGLGLYKDGLFSIIGNRLVELSPESGEERSAKHLKFGVTCPAARNKPYFYVAGTDRRVHALRSEDKVQVFEAAAWSDSEITSIVADEDSVIFATKAGDVISITPDKSKQLWQFKAGDGIAPPIVKDAESLFAASRDTKIYKLDAKGNPVWKYQTGAILEKGPQVTKRTVYQYVGNEGLLAIDKESGRPLWPLPLAEGVDLLAEANGKAYVITKMGTLAVMDNKKAKQVYTVDLSGVSIYAANVADSRIYLADKEGRIACISPIKY